MGGIESTNELPSSREAALLLKRHGIYTRQLTYADVYGGLKVPVNLKILVDNLKYIIYNSILNKKYDLKYPLAGSYLILLLFRTNLLKSLSIIVVCLPLLIILLN